MWQCPRCTLRVVSVDSAESAGCPGCRLYCNLIAQCADAPVPTPIPKPKPVIAVEDHSAALSERDHAILEDMVWN